MDNGTNAEFKAKARDGKQNKGIDSGETYSPKFFLSYFNSSSSNSQVKNTSNEFENDLPKKVLLN